MSEERLRRIEILLETCTKVAVNNQADIRSLIEQTTENKREIKELAAQTNRQISELTAQIASLSQMFVESVGIMRNMQSDIKGLQTENKRILDHLFGENQQN
ncbi:hypothetical protein [Geminocystis sp. GBBB08]|uniref:hypothetical protein n=1 Tax=Geminocystis sp. GBBB08 TaxID=2604140 RepID=UPI0027E2ACDF|nr:hypothetical protein [Geminocystis sp. GBBB08]MBL1208829.1 hypothetical protein [Geminocystis sp. GBBB08]